MALDLNKVKARLSQLANKKKKNADGTYEKTDFTKIFWKPREGEQTIRIVPFKNQPNYPIMEVTFHNDIIKKRYLTLTNFGEKDPIVEFSKELKASKDQEDRDLGWKLSPKTRYFCQVLVRGQEDKGVRLWEFGGNVEKEILKLLNHKSYGDISDVNSGTDLTIEGVKDSFSNGKGGKAIDFIRPDITPERDRTPLDEKEAVIQKYIDEQHDPLAVGMRFTYDQIVGFLEQWLNPEGDEATAGDSTEDAAPEEPVKDAIDEELEVGNEDVGEEESGDIEGEGEEATPEEDELSFVPDPPKPEPKPRNAMAAASKKVIAKNTEEIKAAVKTVVTKPVVAKPVTPKVKATTTPKEEPAPVVKPVAKTTGSTSNKDKFAALFPKK